MEYISQQACEELCNLKKQIEKKFGQRVDAEDVIAYVMSDAYDPNWPEEKE